MKQHVIRRAKIIEDYVRYYVDLSDTHTLKITFHVDLPMMVNIAIDGTLKDLEFQDVSTLSEEELFQMSLIFDYDLQLIKDSIILAKACEETNDIAWRIRYVNE